MTAAPPPPPTSCRANTHVREMMERSSGPAESEAASADYRGAELHYPEAERLRAAASPAAPGRPRGLALYLRRIDEDRHGAPAALAARLADAGLRWVAIAGPWHDAEGRKSINSPATCQRYADACAARGVQPYVWGYPWQGSEELFVDELAACAGEHRLALIDPELGANPARAKGGAGKAAANTHAERLVDLLAERFDGVGLSTFGSGVRMGWFPLLAFARRLALRLPGRAFIGGQTYTDDGAIDASIADFVRVARDVGGLEVVPNFGTYHRAGVGADGKARYRAKTAAELDAHLREFVDEGEPVLARIGWAENFMTPELWRVLREHAERP